MLPERVKKSLARLFHWHLVHKGENVCHFLYLTFTVIEGHGLHAMFAGGVAVFVVIGTIAAGRSRETDGE